jgi:hypothetical protein
MSTEVGSSRGYAAAFLGVTLLGIAGAIFALSSSRR